MAAPAYPLLLSSAYRPFLYTAPSLPPPPCTFRLLHHPIAASFTSRKSLSFKCQLDVGTHSIQEPILAAQHSTTPVEEEPPSRAKLIWRAVKLPIYSVAIVPLSVGTAAAFLETRIFHAGRYCMLLFSAVLVIAWLNLSNDVYDAETGVDKDKKESVVNITGSRKGVLYAAFACLMIGITGIALGTFQSDVKVALLLAAAIACGYIYQCPPFRLGYKGLGEPLCFLSFGPLATTAFYFSQASKRVAYQLPLTGGILGAAVLVGISTSLILFCSHFHQIEGDRLVGKISPLVRLGTQQGSVVVKVTVVGLYSLLAILTATKVLPFSCAFFSLPTLPLGRLVLDFVSKNHTNKEKIFLAKYYCVRLHMAFGVALVLGFLTATQMPTLIPSLGVANCSFITVGAIV